MDPVATREREQINRLLEMQKDADEREVARWLGSVYGDAWAKRLRSAEMGGRRFFWVT